MNNRRPILKLLTRRAKPRVTGQLGHAWPDTRRERKADTDGQHPSPTFTIPAKCLKQSKTSYKVSATNWTPVISSVPCGMKPFSFHLLHHGDDTAPPPPELLKCSPIILPFSRSNHIPQSFLCRPLLPLPASSVLYTILHLLIFDFN